MHFAVLSRRGIEAEDLTPALSGARVPLYYHADIVAPPDDDGWAVQEIFCHERHPYLERRGKKQLFWRVHFNGANRPSLEPACQFVHCVTEKGLQHNRRHNIQVDWSDVS